MLIRFAVIVLVCIPILLLLWKVVPTLWKKAEKDEVSERVEDKMEEMFHLEDVLDGVEEEDIEFHKERQKRLGKILKL